MKSINCLEAVNKSRIQLSWFLCILCDIFFHQVLPLLVTSREAGLRTDKSHASLRYVKVTWHELKIVYGSWEHIIIYHRHLRCFSRTSRTVMSAMRAFRRACYTEHNKCTRTPSSGRSCLVAERRRLEDVHVSLDPHPRVVPREHISGTCFACAPQPINVRWRQHAAKDV